MTACDLLAELQGRGIELAVAGDRLRFRPVSAVGPALRAALAEHKPELLRLLRQDRPPQATLAGQNRPETNAPVPTGRVGRPHAPHELSLAERVATGYVNPGWTPKAWAARLQQLADRCEALRPELAVQYRTWAGNIIALFDR